MKRVRYKQDAFLRDFYKGITLLVIGIVKNRKNTSIAKYITLRISVTRWDRALFLIQYFTIKTEYKLRDNSYSSLPNTDFISSAAASYPACFKRYCLAAVSNTIGIFLPGVTGIVTFKIFSPRISS